MARIPARIPGRELEEFEDKLILSNEVDKTGELKIYGGKAGEKALEIFYGDYSIFTILATGSTAMLLGGSVKPVQIGDAGTTSRGLNKNDDLFVSGRLEADGPIYADGGLQCYSWFTIHNNQPIVIGSGSDVKLLWSTGQATEHTLMLGLGDTAKSIIVCDCADWQKDFDHAAQSNPTIFVHSAVDPDTDNTQWTSISHDGTDGVLDCGKGTLNLGGTNVNFLNATVTGSTVTHDAYVTLEVGGTEYKFMLGS